MRTHPAADLFPMMPSDELQALADDIAANGQKHPIVVTKLPKEDGEGEEDAIVDGRNRFAACEIACVIPIFVSLNGDDPFDYVLSANVRRRKMLTQSQRGIAAAESWPLVGGKPPEGRPPKLGSDYRVTAAEMAKKWEISEATLKQATQLVERDPSAAAGVKVSGSGLEKAYEALLDRERKEKMAEASLEGLRERYPDLAELVSTGSLSLAEALAAGKVKDAELAEERRTRTRVLVELVGSGMPIGHVQQYVKMYDATYDPTGEVTPEALRATAAFAVALVTQVAELSRAEVLELIEGDLAAYDDKEEEA